MSTDWVAFSGRWLIHHSQAFAHMTRWLHSGSGPAQVSSRAMARVGQMEYVENFNAIVNLARVRGAKVIVIGAPYRDSTTNPPESRLMTQYRKALKSTMLQSRTPYLEILELTEAAGGVNEGWFGELIHPNHMGHRLMASELLKLMAQHHFLGDLQITEFVP
jgi:hypothetical protein